MYVWPLHRVFRQIGCDSYAFHLRKSRAKVSCVTAALRLGVMGSLTKGEEDSVHAFEMWCYRQFVRVKCTEQITNKDILEELGMERPVLADRIYGRKQYDGHIIAKGCSLENDLVVGMVSATRKTGRPVVKWRGQRKEGKWSRQDITVQVNRWTETREEWRDSVATATRRG